MRAERALSVGLGLLGFEGVSGLPGFAGLPGFSGLPGFPGVPFGLLGADGMTCEGAAAAVWGEDDGPGNGGLMMGPCPGFGADEVAGGGTPFGGPFIRDVIVIVTNFGPSVEGILVIT